MNQPEVLIVGAGPTGLVLALWLAKSGVQVRIIDKADRPGATSRAIVFHARNLEFYRQLGIDQFALQRGVEFKAANLWLRGKKFARLPFGDFGTDITPYPFSLIFTQDQQEQMLAEQLNLLGVQVERSTELISFENKSDKVVAQLSKKGQIEICEAQYLAGCDGPHSTVREKLGIEFLGGTYEDIYYVADVIGTGPAADGDMHIALDDADFLAIFPMQGEGRMRLVGALRGKDVKKRELKWDDVSKDIIRRLKIEVKEVKWFSTYHVHHRVASQFYKQRAFLSGDAAHVHSPVGGQGMNTGIGDAVNLAWKLAAVIKENAPASLLGSYEPERIAFARRLVHSTDRVFEFVSSRGAIANWIRLNIAPLLLPLLFSFSFLRRFAFLTLSQTLIKYPQSALSVGKAGKVKGGDRLPWVEIENDGKRTDNFESLQSMQWQIHCYGNASEAVKNWSQLNEIALHVFPFNQSARKAGLEKNAIYFVRPDGYVGIADFKGQIELLNSYATAHLGNKTI